MADEIVLSEEQKIALKHFGKDVTDTPAKTQEDIDAEKKLADDQLAIDAQKKKEQELAEAEKNKPVIQKVELTDDELLELASKKSGRKITSWDDLKLSPTEEEKKKQTEDRDSDKIVFGLKNGLFNKKQLESFISDSKSPKDLVYGRELAEAKADDPEWTAEKEKEFQDEFEEKFGLNLDATSSKYKRGQKQITLIADSILKTEYAPIFSLDSAYGKYENDVNGKKSEQQKILAAAPVYKEDVDKVIGGLSKVEMSFGDEKFEIPVPTETIQSLTEVLLDNSFSSSQILKGYKKEELAQIAHQYIISQNYQHLAFEAAKQYRAKHEKGVRGIPEGGKIERPIDQNENLTPQQKQALDFFKIADKPLVAN